MTRLALISALYFFTSFCLSAQLCPDCDEKDEIQYLPRFWEDPDGLLYTPEEINHPDKLGTWIFFKLLSNNQRHIIFTRDVLCLQGLDGRKRKTSTVNEVTLYPNPVIDQITIDHPFSNCRLIIYDVRGIKMFEKSNLKNKTLKINTSEYNSGIYILQIISMQEKVNKVFIVE